MSLTNTPYVFDRLWNQFIDFAPFSQRGELLSGSESQTFFSPRVDIADNKDSVVLSAELPGIPKENVTVEVKNRTLVIKGEKKAEKSAQESGVYRSERAYGNFSRHFTLGEHMDVDSIGASFADGVLTLTIAKRPEISPREIEIQAGESRGKKLT